MSIPDLGRPSSIALDRLPAGGSCEVVAVGAEHERELLREGILPGVRLRVRGVAPAGGPVIVELGRATVAMARPIAATVLVVAQREGLR